MRNRAFIAMTICLFSLMMPVRLWAQKASTSHIDNDHIWEKHLNEINYWVLKISALNIVNGLSLTWQQAEALKNLSSEIDSLAISCPTLEENAFS